MAAQPVTFPDYVPTEVALHAMRYHWFAHERCGTFIEPDYFTFVLVIGGSKRLVQEDGVEARLSVGSVYLARPYQSYTSIPDPESGASELTIMVRREAVEQAWAPFATIVQQLDWDQGPARTARLWDGPGITWFQDMAANLMGDGPDRLATCSFLHGFLHRARQQTALLESVHGLPDWLQEAGEGRSLTRHHNALFPFGGKLEGTVLATSAGDETYRYTELIGRTPRGWKGHNKGTKQTITFPELATVRGSTASLALEATSDSGLPVEYYVAKGPARIEGSALVIDEVPARATFPMDIQVVAWQGGSAVEPLVAPAKAVTQVVTLRAP